jgi:hypothetical protein
MSEDIIISDEGHFIFSEDEILCHRICPQLACGCYIFVLMYALSRNVIQRQTKNWEAISQIYSAVMAIAYGSVALVMFHPVITWIEQHGPLEMLCSEDLHFSRALHTLYFMNYIFGFFRLFDMYLIVMKDGGIPTSAIIVDLSWIFLSWSDMKFELTVQWISVLLRAGMTSVTYWHMSFPKYVVISEGWMKKIGEAWVAILMIEVIARGYALCAKLEFLENGNECYGYIEGMLIGVVVSLVHLAIFAKNLSEM